MTRPTGRRRPTPRHELGRLPEDEREERRQARLAGNFERDRPDGFQLLVRRDRSAAMAVRSRRAAALLDGAVHRRAETRQAILQHVVGGPEPKAVEGRLVAHGAGDDHRGNVPSPLAQALERAGPLMSGRV